MKVTFADKSIAWLALLSGLSISAVAVYYSVAGLISIFAAAAIPIAIMGIVLELSKLVATVWLKQNWFIAPRLIKAYLLIAVTILMVITSMGIFGYLSKAHLDQAVPTGDVVAKVALIDEKIKTERDNIDAAKKALQQMDAQVDQMLGRSDSERGAERAVQIRRNQQKERAALQADIAKAQKAIAALNVERAPVASELRKVEAEVGPIKYIAALLYGDNPDQNVLERAVRWVIILIVIIFDPLAVVLLLASQYSFQYFRRVKEEQDVSDSTPSDSVPVVGPVVRDEPVVEQPVEQPAEEIVEEVKEPLPTRSDYTSPGPCPNCGKHLIEAKGIDIFCPDAECEYNKSGDPEVDAFFARLRETAKEIDEEKYEADDGPLTEEQIEQLRQQAEQDLPKGEVVKTDNLFEENQEPYPFPMERPLEGYAKLEQDIINSMPVLENEETWAQTVIDEHDEPEDTDAKRKWKMLNPQDTIKRQRSLYEKGLIEQLPWETIEQFDAERDADLEKLEQVVEKLTPDIIPEVEDPKKKELYSEGTGSTSQEEKIEYVQNSEQDSSSLWKKIQEQKDN